MPKRTHVTEADLEWLRGVQHEITLIDQAARVGCCVDTLKRILVRHGIRAFSGAKYVLSRATTDEVVKWSRPCSRCGCTKQRPKFQFRCDACHMGESDNGW